MSNITKYMLAAVTFLMIILALTSRSTPVSAQGKGKGSQPWRLEGNAQTDPANNFLGTTDEQSLVIRTNAQERVRVTGGGNVGIGTSNPGNFRLAVNGTENNGTSASVRIMSGAGANQQTMLLDGNEIDGVNAGLFLNNNSDENVVLATGGGNVGIGTSNPSHRANIVGGGNAISGSNVDIAELNTVFRRSNNAAEAVGIGFSHSTNPANVGAAIIHERTGGDSRGSLHFATKASTALGANLPIRMTIMPTGNVGIGVSNPNNRLSVRDQNHQLAIIDSDNSNKTWTLTSHQATSGVGLWENGNQGRFIVTAGGRVGIGTTNPNHELVVQGNNPAMQIRDDTTDNSANAARLELLERAGGNFDGGAFFWWNGETNKLLIGTKVDGDNTNVLVVDRVTSSVGIGTQNPGNFRLAVNGSIRAKEIVVKTGWSDFVFEPDYHLLSLEEVDAHIKEHGRLPDIPSAEQVAEHGVKVGEMEAKLLQKVEELTLHVIDMNKRVQALEQENTRLRSRSVQLAAASRKGGLR